MLSDKLPFAQPWLLLALPLALLALWRRPQAVLLHSWSALLPRDRLSGLLETALRVLAVLAIAALLLGLAGLFRPAYEIERMGQGAEIMLLVDRSRSMDQAFISVPTGGIGQAPGVATFNIGRLQADKDRPSKQHVARRILGEFAAQRTADRFGMLVFSTLPIRALEFTEKPAAVQAAIAALEVGRGLAETDIGLALQAGLASFRDRPYSGSRIMMLVSDGGDVLDAHAQQEIAQRMREYRVSLYWFYIRSYRSPGLTVPPGEESVATEVQLHRYFQSLGTPYKAYEAENPQALQRAINDVNRLENLPITYTDTVPRRDLSQWCYGLALACVLLLLLAKSMELRAWR